MSNVLSTDKVFDILPYMVDVYDKLKLDDYRVELSKKYKGKKVDQIQVGIDVFKYILKNSGMIKEEVISIVAIVENKSETEVREQSFTKSVLALKNIVTNTELSDFFKQAM